MLGYREVSEQTTPRGRETDTNQIIGSDKWKDKKEVDQTSWNTQKEETTKPGKDRMRTERTRNFMKAVLLDH